MNALADVAVPKSIPTAVEQITELKQENERLKKELSLMAETAQRFIHNASLHGVTPVQLMKPLPQQDRSE